MAWIQYDLVTGLQMGLNGQQVNDSLLLALGLGQIFFDGDPTGVNVDVSLSPNIAIVPPGGELVTDTDPLGDSTPIVI